MASIAERIFLSSMGEGFEASLSRMLVTGVVTGSDFYSRGARKLTGSPALDPMMAVVAKRLGDPVTDWDLSDIPSARARFDRGLVGAPAEGVVVGELFFETLAGRLRCEHYSVSGVPKSGTAILYLHPGGFVFGSPEGSRCEATLLVATTRLTGYSFAYSLAPETKFPGALDEVGTLIAELLKQHDSIVLVGESAGAGLALSAVLSDPGLAQGISAMVLAYPFADMTLSSDSNSKFAHGPYLTRGLLEWFVDQYLPAPADAANVQASPVRALTGSDLPPTFVVCAEFDPLLDDGLAIAQLGGPNVQLHVEKGTFHGFLSLRGLSVGRDRSLAKICDFIGLAASATA